MAGRKGNQTMSNATWRDLSTVAMAIAVILVGCSSSTSIAPPSKASSTSTCRTNLALATNSACGTCAAAKCQEAVNTYCSDATYSQNTQFIETCFNGGDCLPVARQTLQPTVDLGRCLSGSCNVECALPVVACTSDAQGCSCTSGSSDGQRNGAGCTTESATPPGAPAACCRFGPWPASGSCACTVARCFEKAGDCECFPDADDYLRSMRAQDGYRELDACPHTAAPCCMGNVGERDFRYCYCTLGEDCGNVFTPVEACTAEAVIKALACATGGDQVDICR